MYAIMKNLITNKYYKTKEEATAKLSIFFAYNVITQAQYDELMLLADTQYAKTTEKHVTA